MKILSTKEMLIGLEVSNISLYAWIREGMPVLRRSHYLFNEKSLAWVIENKERFKELAEKMLKKLEG